MCNEIQIALIGVLGTLLGTILGWILNSLANRGKLILSLKNFETSITKNTASGQKNCTNLNEADFFIFSLAIDIYNSSSSNKIMQNVKLVFVGKKTTLFIYDLPNNNIEPKTIKNFTYKNCMGKRENFKNKLTLPTSIYLHYTNEKGRKKKIFLTNITISDIIENYKEEQTNEQA